MLSVSFNAANGTLTITGTESLADYQAVLRTVKYRNTSQNPNTSTRTVTFTVNDGDVNSNLLTRDITVTAINDPPTVTAPGAFTAIGNVRISVPDGASDLLSNVSDPEGTALRLL
jgi:hypothetical protein